jgi:hypothetical protein
MKKVMTLSFIMFALMLCFSFTAAGEPDVKGSKDHPLISRMPDF